METLRFASIISFYDALSSNGDIKVCFCDAFTSINDIKRESPEHQIARMSKN